MDKAITLEIDQRYFSAIGHFFSPVVLSKLEKYNHSYYLSEVCRNSGLLKNIDLSITLGHFLDLIYEILLKKYRNEYVYKNVIANKVLLGRHSLNTTQMLTEFRVGKNKADAVILNGSSTAYEIKSEYDSFTRLDKQIQSYLKAFEYINLITSPSQIEKIKNHLPKNIGILSFTKKNTISIIREPQSNFKNIDFGFLFDSLRRDEYLNIIKRFYGNLPDVPNTKIYQFSKKLYCNIPPIDAHKLTIDILKKRNSSKYLQECIDEIPKSVVVYILGLGNYQKKIKNMLRLFKNELSQCIV